MRLAFLLLTLAFSCSTLQKYLPYGGPEINTDPVAQKKLQVKLQKAIAATNVEAVNALLDDGADPDYKTVRGASTPIIATLTELKLTKNKKRRARLVAIFDAILDHSRNSNVPDENGNTALHFVIFNNQTEFVEPLLNKNADLNARGSNGYTPLMAAAHRGNLPIAKNLLEKSNINAKDIYGNTALMLAIYKNRNGDPDRNKLSELLLHSGADTKLANKSYGHTALHLAIYRNNTRIIKQLCPKGGLEIRNYGGLTPFLMAVHDNYSGRLDILQALTTCGANSQAKDHKGNSALFMAKNLPVIRYLNEDLKLSINEVNKKQQTVLDYHLKYGYWPVIRFLLEKQAQYKNKQASALERALLRSVRRRDKETFDLILDNGFDVKTKSPYGRSSALLSAIYYQEQHMLNRLLASGAEVNIQNRAGNTALHLAAKNGNIELCRRLIGLGAKIKAQNNIRYSPLMFASRHGHKEIVKLLLDRGADVNGQDRYGNSVLMWAAWYGHKEVVVELLKHNPTLDVQNNNYRNTALILAAMKGHEDIAKILLSTGADGDLQNKAGHDYLSVPAWQNSKHQKN